mmetsp:Transcript_17852/g.39066  ORF Transcript_17852/g.39066 Transcript_17852/m.39066 type:complete len:368 (+) Transcript_17852:282-1385(+)
MTANRRRRRRIRPPSNPSTRMLLVLRGTVLCTVFTLLIKADAFAFRPTDGYNMMRRRSFLTWDVLSGAVLLIATLGSSPPAHAAEEPPECRNGAIVAESQVPGAYQQICMELPTRTIPIQSTGDALTISQGTGTGTGGTGSVQGRTGVAVWNSSLLLTRLLDAISAQEIKQPMLRQGSSFLKGKTVMELGCGTGLASLAAAKLGASRVIATDGNSEVVQLTKFNIDKNNLVDNVEAAELKWGLLNAADFFDEADIIIGSDLTYNSGTWRVLAETMGAVLKPDGLVLYLSLGHSGFNVSGELGGFLSVVESEGLELIDESSDRWPFYMDGSVSSVSRLLSRCVSASERTVLDSNGGARVIVLGRKKRK